MKKAFSFFLLIFKLIYAAGFLAVFFVKLAFRSNRHKQAVAEPDAGFPDRPEAPLKYYGLLFLPPTQADPLLEAGRITAAATDEDFLCLVAHFQFRSKDGELQAIRNLKALPPIHCLVDSQGKRSDWETIREGRMPHYTHNPKRPENHSDEEYHALWESFLWENQDYWYGHLRSFCRSHPDHYAILLDCDEKGEALCLSQGLSLDTVH